MQAGPRDTRAHCRGEPLTGRSSLRGASDPSLTTVLVTFLLDEPTERRVARHLSKVVTWAG